MSSTPETTRGARRRSLPAWVPPVVVLGIAVIAVWWFVFRESDAERGQRLITEARQAMDAQDMPTAEARLKEALEIAPQSGLLLHNLGVLYLRENRLADARSAFERAAATYGPEANEVRAEELFQLAGISYTEKKWDLAAHELEQAIRAHPSRAQLHTRLLDLQLGRLNQPDRAESTTTRFLRVCGRTPRTLGDAAFVHYQHKSYEAAAQLAQQAVAEQDSFVEGHALFARSLWRMGRTQEGLASLAGPLARYPGAPELWVAQSLLLLETGARTSALAAADQAVKAAPESFDAHQARHKALAALGRYPEALQELGKAQSLTQDPGEQRMLLTQQRILRGVMQQSGEAPPGAAPPAADVTTDSAATP